jgi:hypothetical protein
LITSTVYTVLGDVDDAATRALKAEIYLLPGVGAIAFEIEEGKDTRLILKHKEDETVDRAALDAAVHRAGDYRLG